MIVVVLVIAAKLPVLVFHGLIFYGRAALNGFSGCIIPALQSSFLHHVSLKLCYKFARLGLASRHVC